MQRCLAIVGGVLVAIVLAALSSYLPEHPRLFFLGVDVFSIGVGVFYGGGRLDGRGPAIPVDHGAKPVYVVVHIVRLVLAACGGILVTWAFAAFEMPPAWSELVWFLLWSAVFSVFYVLGFRKSRSQPPKDRRVCFTRPFQYFLVLLVSICALLVTIDPSGDSVILKVTGSLFLISSMAVLFVFRPRRIKTENRKVKNDGIQPA